ncbi:hypothetical protein C922_05508, partial [Plasmodium inui San Antonio 1]
NNSRNERKYRMNTSPRDSAPKSYNKNQGTEEVSYRTPKNRNKPKNQGKVSPKKPHPQRKIPGRIRRPEEGSSREDDINPKRNKPGRNPLGCRLRTNSSSRKQGKSHRNRTQGNSQEKGSNNHKASPMRIRKEFIKQSLSCREKGKQGQETKTNFKPQFPNSNNGPPQTTRNTRSIE